MTGEIVRVHKRVHPESLEKDLKELCRIVHQEWKENNIKIEKLSGGLLNEIFKCYSQTQDSHTQDSALVIRLYTSQDVCNLVSRSGEIIAMQVGHKAGVSQPLHVIFDNGLVYGFAPGSTANWGLLWDDNVARQYLGCLAKFHMTDPSEMTLVDHSGNLTSIERKEKVEVFDKLRNVIKTIPEEFNNIPERKERMKKLWSKERFQEEINLLEKHFSQFQMNITFSHNDCWVNNAVYDKETDKLSLLDFEYCDYSYEAYDVGVLFNCFQIFELYREVFPTNIMIPTDDEMELPRTEEHRKKLVRFYMEEKCKYLGKEPSDYSNKDFTNFHIQTEMLSIFVNLYWTIFGLAQADDPTVRWNLFGASESAFHHYCDQRETLFDYKPC